MTCMIMYSVLCLAYCIVQWYVYPCLLLVRRTAPTSNEPFIGKGYRGVM
jgi:hypothetical protein